MSTATDLLLSRLIDQAERIATALEKIAAVPAPAVSSGLLGARKEAS